MSNRTCCMVWGGRFCLASQLDSLVPSLGMTIAAYCRTSTTRQKNDPQVAEIENLFRGLRDRCVDAITLRFQSVRHLRATASRA
jgi:hypothetical protein